MHVLLLHNEGAGDEEWSRRELVKLVRSAGFAPKYHALDDALEHPQRLVGGEFVIAAGGDGSIRRTALKLLGRGVPLAPLPIGTANNISRSLGLSGDPRKVVAGWAGARRCRFDVGVAEGPWGRKRFVEGIGVGLISRTVDLLRRIDRVSAIEPDESEQRVNRAAYVAAALASAMQPLQARVTFDGRQRSGAFLMIEWMNIRRAGPALQLAPAARVTDGQLELVTVTERERAQLVRVAEDRIAEKSRARRLPTQRARSFRLVAEEAVSLRIDDRSVRLDAGEIVTAHIDPGALEFLLPRV